MKIYLIAGHHNNDTGAVSGAYREASLTKELRDLVKKELPSVLTDDDNDTLSQVIKKIESDTEDKLICDLHFNCSDNPIATGTEVLIPSISTSTEKHYAAVLAKLVSDRLECSNRGVKNETQSARGRLAIMRPNGINLLLEVCFISNPEDMRCYQVNKFALAQDLALFLRSVSELA